ncbi:tetratricopeptide repeat protein [Methylobacterium oryzihabitans]|uniref:Tetratricopeptide repeat protein n=1 Tax=Methylobacterium oryzihabitans TaxID=2499852 RepID=A0A437NW13_9HYPH|nr:tetratricopeptide repeat protein [Methylobacterium oryzihabitans]RVU14209.1 tetratricopeptide repeat protein [Methylobacterium oryzihabitans]
MSILDGMPQSDADMKFIVASASTIVETVLGLSAKTPRAQSILEAMREGLSLADILKIPKEERDALLAQGIRQMQVGDVAGAQATLTTLYYLEPLDARAIYALATTYQAQGNYGAAGKLYAGFLALDATNADGYLRLAECFMANRETEQARACFEVGKGEAVSAGQADRVAHADRMLALLGGPTEHAA